MLYSPNTVYTSQLYGLYAVRHIHHVTSCLAKIRQAMKKAIEHMSLVVNFVEILVSIDFLYLTSKYYLKLKTSQ